MKKFRVSPFVMFMLVAVSILSRGIDSSPVQTLQCLSALLQPASFVSNSWTTYTIPTCNGSKPANSSWAGVICNSTHIFALHLPPTDVIGEVDSLTLDGAYASRVQECIDASASLTPGEALLQSAIISVQRVARVVLNDIVSLVQKGEIHVSDVGSVEIQGGVFVSSLSELILHPVATTISALVIADCLNVSISNLSLVSSLHIDAERVQMQHVTVQHLTISQPPAVVWIQGVLEISISAFYLYNRAGEALITITQFCPANVTKSHSESTTSTLDVQAVSSEAKITTTVDIASCGDVKISSLSTRAITSDPTLNVRVLSRTALDIQGLDGSVVDLSGASLTIATLHILLQAPLITISGVHVSGYALTLFVDIEGTNVTIDSVTLLSVAEVTGDWISLVFSACGTLSVSDFLSSVAGPGETVVYSKLTLAGHSSVHLTNFTFVDTTPSSIPMTVSSQGDIFVQGIHRRNSGPTTMALTLQSKAVVRDIEVYGENLPGYPPCFVDFTFKQHELSSSPTLVDMSLVNNVGGAVVVRSFGTFSWHMSNISATTVLQLEKIPTITEIVATDDAAVCSRDATIELCIVNASAPTMRLSSLALPMQRIRILQPAITALILYNLTMNGSALAMPLIQHFTAICVYFLPAFLRFADVTIRSITVSSSSATSVIVCNASQLASFIINPTAFDTISITGSPLTATSSSLTSVCLEGLKVPSQRSLLLLMHGVPILNALIINGDFSAAGDPNICPQFPSAQGPPRTAIRGLNLSSIVFLQSLTLLDVVQNATIVDLPALRNLTLGAVEAEAIFITGSLVCARHQVATIGKSAMVTSTVVSLCGSSKLEHVELTSTAAFIVAVFGFQSLRTLYVRSNGRTLEKFYLHSVELLHDLSLINTAIQQVVISSRSADCFDPLLALRTAVQQSFIVAVPSLTTLRLDSSTITVIVMDKASSLNVLGLENIGATSITTSLPSVNPLTAFCSFLPLARASGELLIIGSSMEYNITALFLLGNRISTLR